MVWRVTNEPVDCRPSRGTNKHTQDRKRCSLLDDNSTATADYDSAHANYTVNIIFFSLLDSDWLKSVPINP